MLQKYFSSYKKGRFLTDFCHLNWVLDEEWVGKCPVAGGHDEPVHRLGVAEHGLRLETHVALAVGVAVVRRLRAPGNEACRETCVTPGIVRLRFCLCG